MCVKIKLVKFIVKKEYFFFLSKYFILLTFLTSDKKHG